MAHLDLGVMLPSVSATTERPGDMASTARHAEGLGLESVWVVDQLVAGTGSPILDSVVALTAAATSTSRVRLGFGVMILPLRPTVWVAKQVASLQHVSGDRVILGVGVGGDRHEQSWVAAGVPRRERGRRTDAALRVLPSLIAGAPTPVTDDPRGPEIRLAPPAAVPPILVGGSSEAALARAGSYADGWFSLSAAASGIAEERARVLQLAAAQGRPPPTITAAMLAVLTGDPRLPDDASLARLLTDPDGPYGIPAEYLPDFLVTGGPDEVAARLASYADAGAERVVVSLPAGDWYRQAEFVAEAHALVE
jgi:alkanesulfonate monooxygenase SsuD/methylene tetrahydromethanopterin reductase-like flavin-dependent oxidoreductase (luciferase family)